MSGGRQRTLPEAWRRAPGPALQAGRDAAVNNDDNDDDDELLAAAAAELDPNPNPNPGPEAAAGGFCSAAGALWIYPSNRPERSYQLRMARAALLSNTLLCLPTGLGKTFVAAVVMYNFYRWFPSGKVLFLAPTKALVAQQMEACAQLMGIPGRDMAEMTGRAAPRGNGAGVRAAGRGAAPHRGLGCSAGLRGSGRMGSAGEPGGGSGDGGDAWSTSLRTG